jgi:hypothetical protein
MRRRHSLPALPQLLIEGDLEPVAAQGGVGFHGQLHAGDEKQGNAQDRQARGDSQDVAADKNVNRRRQACPHKHRHSQVEQHQGQANSGAAPDEALELIGDVVEPFGRTI